MPYSSHHDISQYYSDGLSSGTNSNNLNSTNSNSNSSNSSLNSSPTSPLHLPHPQQQQQQHQRQYKSSPESSLPSSTSSASSSSSLSPMSESSTSVYPGTITSSSMSSFSAALFTQADDVDMQPLDLSLRPVRDDPACKRPRLAEHKPVCLVKSCVCNLGNSRAQRLSPYPILTHSMSRSPNSRMGSSPQSRTDSPFYVQRQTPSPAYYNGMTSSSGYYISPPPPPPLPAAPTASESSSFQILTSSDSVLNGTPNPAGLFRPYDDHIDNNLNHINSSTSIDHNHEPHMHEEQEEEPTYMDLDSATPRSLHPKLRCVIGSTSSLYSSQSIPHVSSAQHRDTKVKTGLSPGQHESQMMLASSTRNGRDSSEMKTSSYYVGNTMSHVAADSHQNGSRDIAYPASECSSTDVVDRPKPQQLQQQQEQMPSQMYQPDSSSSTGGVSSSTGHVTTLRLYPSDPQAVSFQYSNSGTHTRAMSRAEDGRCPPVSQSEHQSPEPHSTPNLGGRNSLSNKENTTSGSKSKKFATSSNFFQLPVTTTCDIDIIGNKHRRNGEHRNIPTSSSVCRPSLGGDDNEGTTRISLLDFWISKILMERSAGEAPSPPNKPCNVDYIRTVDGEKKIRLRLVDLIELQVEQSLKA